MLRTSTHLALFAVAALALGACKKKDDAPPTAGSAAPVTTASSGGSTAPAADGPSVTFAGSYKKVAEDTIKNGRHLHLTNEDGNTTITIDKGTVTWMQNYVIKGQKFHANQIYTFGSSDIKTISNGFHVTLTWKSLDTEDTHYNPDKNNPQVEAHKTATGWDIALSTTDTNGVVSGVEFK